MTDTLVPDPNDQMVEPELGNDEMQQWLNSIGDERIDLPSLLPPTKINTAVVENPEPEQPDEEEEADEEQEDEQTSEPTDEFFTVNGQQISKADVQRLYEFDQYMRSNPDVAQRVNTVLTGAPTGAPAVPEATTQTPTSFEPPTPPEDMDLDDPNIRFMWDQAVDIQKRVFEFEQAQRAQSEALAANQQRINAQQAQADMDTALSTFKQQFEGLNEDDIAIIRRDAAPILPAMMQQLSPVEALRRSMETAGWANPELRHKMIADSDVPNPTARQRSNARKAKATSVSGSPRSAPKVESRPAFASDRDMVNAIAQDIAENLQR